MSQKATASQSCGSVVEANWLLVHNGFIADFQLLRRDMMFAIDPKLFPEGHGSTGSEVVFHLALTPGARG